MENEGQVLPTSFLGKKQAGTRKWAKANACEKLPRSIHNWIAIQFGVNLSPPMWWFSQNSPSCSKPAACSSSCSHANHSCGKCNATGLTASTQSSDVICSSHTNRGVNKVGLRKLDAAWLAMLGNHHGGCVPRRLPIVPQWSQLLHISRVSTTLGCCQCKSLDRWPLSFTMSPKQEWLASILHKLDAAKKCPKRDKPRGENSCSCRFLVLFLLTCRHGCWSPFAGPV